MSLDLPSLDRRLETLQAVNDQKPYQVQSPGFEKSLRVSFLLYRASPRDVTHFLVWKDRKGKTKVQVPTCSLFGAKKAEVCSCPSKLLRLCSFLKESIFATQILPLQRYIYARDLAFFCLEFFAGDRASDLGRIFTKEVLTLPDDEGFLFKHTFGKTLRGKNSNTFMVKKCSNTTVCPVSNLRLYVQLCDLMTVNLRDGHLFRTTNKSTVSTSPFIGSAVANRLVQHLKTLDIHNGESMHSFRRGCSITLSLLGVTSEEVARHVGWRSLDTAEYYTLRKS